MAQNEKQINLAYRILQIYTLEFSFKDLDMATLEHFFNTPNSLALHTNTKLDINKDNSTINIDIKTKLFEKEKENNVFVNHAGRTVFKIKDLEQVFNMEDETYELPDALLGQLFGLSYSHVRALLAMETSPTIYKDKYILPVVNPTTFLTKRREGE